MKKDVKSLINLVKVRKMRQEHDLPVPPMSLHLVFMGNPGTGKTTVGPPAGQDLPRHRCAVKGQLVEVDRSGLVAGFVGQTAIKTSEVIQKALGGVLFIDEAYALANQDSPNDFGKEAIEALLKGMEDHRADLIVIVAGYTELMSNFINANPGLESRFNKYFYFEDYNGGGADGDLPLHVQEERLHPGPGDGQVCLRGLCPALRGAGRELRQRPGTCATSLSGRWPARPTGWRPWRTQARRT